MIYYRVFNNHNISNNVLFLRIKNLKVSSIGAVLFCSLHFYVFLLETSFTEKYFATLLLKRAKFQVKLILSGTEAIFKNKAAISFVTITCYLHIRFYLYLLFHEIFTSKILSLKKMMSLIEWGINSFRYWKYCFFLY